MAAERVSIRSLSDGGGVHTLPVIAVSTVLTAVTVIPINVLHVPVTASWCQSTCALSRPAMARGVETYRISGLRLRSRSRSRRSRS